jgi:crossover junction endodeoxyribonuclease RusA
MMAIQQAADRPTCFFRIDGKPATQGSKNHLGRGILVESCKRLPCWRSDARGTVAAIKPDHWPMGGPFHVTMTALFERPRSHSIGGHGRVLKATAPSYPGRVGDVDKIARALLDAMTGFLWDDDAQVVTLECEKRYAQLGDQPHMVVYVRSLECPYFDRVQLLTS